MLKRLFIVLYVLAGLWVVFLASSGVNWSAFDIGAALFTFGPMLLIFAIHFIVGWGR